MKKEMKRAVVMILSFALTGAVLMGCSESQQSNPDTQQDSSQSVSQETQQDTVVDEVETESTEISNPATASGKILTQEYTAVICIALRSFTLFPEVEFPRKKL